MESTIYGNNIISPLDKIRSEESSDALGTYFNHQARVNRNKAISLINDENLCFSTLYILRHIITHSGIIHYLNDRNIRSLKLVNGIYRKDTRYIDLLMKNNKKKTGELLRWIFITGSDEDGYDNCYDEIMELTAALLIRYYNDDTILPVIADMIFKRNKKDLLIHNLVWVFFEARKPDSMLYIAKHLCSEHQKDYELAKRLIGFIPGVNNYKFNQGQDIYNSVNHWIRENSQSLYPTGECLHLTASPVPYRILDEGR